MARKKKWGNNSKQITYTVNAEKHKALTLLKALDGHSSVQDMIDKAVDEMYGKSINNLKTQGLLDSK